MIRTSYQFLTALVVASTVVLSGCSTKPNKSAVLVAPLGVPSGADVGYMRGELGSNSTAVTTTADNLQTVVYFGFDQSIITTESANVLDQHANLLSNNPNASVLVAGHTDERGSREYNMALGERRAQAVRDYLTSQGVNPANIQVVSYGEEQPIATGSTEADHAQNRRAELSY